MPSQKLGKDTPSNAKMRASEIHRRVAPGGRKDAEGKGDQQRHGHAGAGEDQGCGQMMSTKSARGLVIIGFTEIPVQRVAQINHILDGQRLIQAKMIAQAAMSARVGWPTRNMAAAGSPVRCNATKDDQANTQEHQDALGDPAQI